MHEKHEIKCLINNNSIIENYYKHKPNNQHKYRQKEITFCFDDWSDPMEEASEFWVSRRLVVDELDFDGLHGRDSQDGLRYSGTCHRKKQKAVSTVMVPIVHHTMDQ